MDDSVLDRPFEKVELTNRGLHNLFVVVGDRDALPPAKRIESALRICLEFELVIVVDLETVRFGGFSGVGKFVHCIIFFGVVSDEPVDNT
jgi:hypothetical protein